MACSIEFIHSPLRSGPILLRVASLPCFGNQIVQAWPSRHSSSLWATFHEPRCSIQRAWGHHSDLRLFAMSPFVHRVLGLLVKDHIETHPQSLANPYLEPSLHLEFAVVADVCLLYCLFFYDDWTLCA